MNEFKMKTYIQALEKKSCSVSNIVSLSADYSFESKFIFDFRFNGYTFYTDVIIEEKDDFEEVIYKIDNATDLYIPYFYNHIDPNLFNYWIDIARELILNKAYLFHNSYVSIHGIRPLVKDILVDCATLEDFMDKLDKIDISSLDCELHNVEQTLSI